MEKNTTIVVEKEIIMTMVVVVVVAVVVAAVATMMMTTTTVKILTITIDMLNNALCLMSELCMVAAQTRQHNNSLSVQVQVFGSVFSEAHAAHIRCSFPQGCETLVCGQ